MSKRNDGGSAFPEISGDEIDSIGGMSLRDWFAGQVLAATAEPWALSGDQTNRDDKDSRRILARECYDMADAMLKARAKKC